MNIDDWLHALSPEAIVGILFYGVAPVGLMCLALRRRRGSP